MPAANGAKGNPASKRMMNASKKQKRVVNKAKNMRIHGKVKNPITSHSKPVAKMQTEMVRMIDPAFVQVLSDV